MTRQRILIAIFFLLTIGVLGYYFRTSDAPPASIEFAVPQKIRAGETFDIPLRISTSVAMNAGEYYFSFPSELLEVQAIDRGGSFYALWITNQPAFNNELGQLSFAGGLPKPGFTGKDGLVATVRVKAKQPGTGSITLDQERSRILANDGLGTQINASFEPISFTIK